MSHSQATDAPASLLDRLKVASLFALPQHLLSALMLRATRIRWPVWKNWQIRWFVRRYGVDMSEACATSPAAYPDFNAFFTRALKPELRPICEGLDCVACPADGTLSQAATVCDGSLLQVKGIQYSLATLLGGDDALAERFEAGVYATIYLSPRDYHRVHMPLTGRLTGMRHVPGRLFSVNPLSTRLVPGLLARNERVVSLFETDFGLLAVVLVGAVFVGSIEQVWAGTVTPRSLARPSALPERLTLAKGEEMGRFNMGSTVVMVLANPRLRWDPESAGPRQVWVGERLGRIGD